MSTDSCNVAVVIPCFNQAHFLAGAIESATAQSRPPSEIVVVDDGSIDATPRVASSFSQVRVIRQPNLGLAAARNAGLASVSADKVIFLDADDQLLPDGIAYGLACFADLPNAAFVYGGYRLVRRGREQDRFRPAPTRLDLIRCNWIGMIGSVMFDRRKIQQLGGFDESLGMCEDWDLYLRASREFPFGMHPHPVARYVWHGRNMSRDRPRLLRWIEVVRQKERSRGLAPEEEAAWEEGQAVVAAAYAGPLARAAARLRKALGLVWG